MTVKINQIKGGRLPEYQRTGDVCMDCYARCPVHIDVPAGKRALVPLGFALELPEGYEAIIRPRSGLSLKGLDVAIGTIDSNYRGEVMACLVNNTGIGIAVENETRVCQIAIREAPHIEWEVVSKLNETERGDNGFGSSGK